jgi:Zn-dependent protease
MEGPPPLRQNDIALSRLERNQQSIPREAKERRGLMGALAALGVLIAKFFGPILKFLPLILKSGGSMLLSIGAYGLLWGWKWAVGFVLLIFIHECGHLVAARQFGLKVGAPVFIPFMGAVIALKEAPRNAWIEAWVGIGGPLLGSAGALVCHALGEQLNAPLLIGLAWTGYWLNLFNLIPVGQLDGGRIVTALSPWLWLVGAVLMAILAFLRPNMMLFIILAFVIYGSIPRFRMLFRQRTDAEQRYYEVTPNQRLAIGFCYFGLIAALVFGMHVADLQLSARGIINH